jgi:Uma2 family endonuclease
MTTTLPYKLQPAPIEDLISFDPDPGPLPDAMQQDEPLQELLHILAARFTGFGRIPGVFLSSNTFICYDPADLNVRVAPDCYLAFGVDTHAIRRRRLYLPWEVGKPPDFALEVASESTGWRDVVEKRAIYARIGIPEYWRFDPTGGEFHDRPLAGDRLEDGDYQPIELTEEPDGLLKGYSPTLELSLCWNDGRLTFYEPSSGTYLRNLGEQATALGATQATLGATQDALEESKVRVRQLEEQLRRTQPEE